MAICSFGPDYTRGGSTLIDNLFLLSYLPAADGTDVKVYLYGLMKATEGGGKGDADHLETIGLALHVPPERVQQAFSYWAEKGLVSVREGQIVYHSPKAPRTPVVKLNAADYAEFVEECARAFPEKTLSENELLALIETMREHKIEADAMLMMMKYCIDSRAAASVPYVLSVAKDWAEKGVHSVAQVEAHIAELENNREEMRQLFAALGKRSQPQLEDRLLYQKWREETGYSPDVILAAARSLKRKGGIEKLDATLHEMVLAHVTNAEEANAFLLEKKSRYELAEQITVKLGSRYGDYESAVNTFITPWLHMGFDANALKQIADICFVRNVRSLEGMGRTVKEFYKLGLLNAPAIVAFVDEQVRLDEAVREVLAAAGAAPYVVPFDRAAYTTFVREWGYEHEDILCAARALAGRPFPFQRLNKQLAAARQAGVTGGEELARWLQNNAPTDPPSTRKSAKKGEADYTRHHYTPDQLNGLFLTLDQLEDPL